MPTSHLDGSTAIRTIASKVSNPKLFTGMTQRVEFCSSQQVYALTDNEFEMVRKHMGHSRAVFDEIYKRLHRELNQSRVRALLCINEKGAEAMRAQTNQSLKTICVDFWNGRFLQQRHLLPRVATVIASLRRAHHQLAAQGIACLHTLRLSMILTHKKVKKSF